ncbi:MAG: transcription elongation factor GreA [Spirochaetia bacterium]|jgi:transcription elongation factor GreA|nr:transcription elongation factor GreA [Spirochaetia bacterium]
MSNDIEQKKKALKEELEQLKYEFKVALPKVIAQAREYGDLKENAEYHSARERQSFVQAKIGQVSEQLAQLDNLDISNIPSDKVGYGSTVTLVEKSSGDVVEFTFVSSNDVDPAEGKISLSTPFGTALLNKTAGEDVEITVPAGKRLYYIKKLVTIHGEKIEK